MRLLRTALLMATLTALTLAVSPAGADNTPSPAEMRTLLTQLQDHYAAPGRTVAVAAKTLGTPDKAFAFVRDDIALMTYRGAWAGAEGTLRTRIGSSSDKAALLQALLAEMKVPARLVRAAWPKGAAPSGGVPTARPHPAEAKLAALVRRRARTPLIDHGIEDMSQEIDAAAKAIALRLDAAGMRERIAGAPESAEPTRTGGDWVWVEAQLDGSTWSTLDPVFPDLERPAKRYVGFAPQPVIVTVRVLGGAKALLSWSGPTSTVVGRDLHLMLMPANGKPKDADDPTAVADWRPFFRAGKQEVVGKAFTPGAAAPRGPFGPMLAPGGGATATKDLTLELTFRDPGGRRRWTGTYSRTIQRFTKGFDKHRLVSTYKLTIGTGYLPAQVVQSRVLDEALATDVFLRRTKDTKIEIADALSSRSARVLNDLFVLQAALAPKGMALGWKGPAVVLESVSLRKAAKLQTVRRLDVLHRAFGPAAGASRSERIRYGLATAAIEGRLLGTASVNRQLLSAKGPLTVVTQETAGDLARYDRLTQQVLTDGGVLISNTTARDYGWLLPVSGDLLPVAVEGGVLAKGSWVTAETAGQGFGALGSAAMGALGSPGSMMVSVVAAYLNALRGAWGNLADRMEGVAKAIETGDGRYALPQGDEYFNDLARRLTEAIVSGALRGWGESAGGALINHVLPTEMGPFGPTVGDRVIDGIIAGGLGYPTDLPGVSAGIDMAMDMVFGVQR